MAMEILDLSQPSEDEREKALKQYIIQGPTSFCPEDDRTLRLPDHGSFNGKKAAAEGILQAERLLGTSSAPEFGPHAVGIPVSSATGTASISNVLNTPTPGSLPVQLLQPKEETRSPATLLSTNPSSRLLLAPSTTVVDLTESTPAQVSRPAVKGTPVNGVKPSKEDIHQFVRTAIHDPAYSHLIREHLIKLASDMHRRAQAAPGVLHSSYRAKLAKMQTYPPFRKIDYILSRSSMMNWLVQPTDPVLLTMYHGFEARKTNGAGAPITISSSPSPYVMMTPGDGVKKPVFGQVSPVSSGKNVKLGAPGMATPLSQEMKPSPSFGQAGPSSQIWPGSSAGSDAIKHDLNLEDDPWSLHDDAAMAYGAGRGMHSAYRGDITTLFDDYHLEGFENNEDVARATTFLGLRTRTAAGTAPARSSQGSPPQPRSSQSTTSPVRAGSFYPTPRETPSGIRGLKIELMPHQTLGLEFMVKREDHFDLFAKKQTKVNRCRGGILADEMGLGKTIQTLALMCHNRESNDGKKATLIIAPLALLEQWKREICEKTEPNVFNIAIYHGLSKPRSLAALETFNVVLTTYHTLIGECPKREKSKTTGKRENEADWEIRFEEEKGPLFRVEWHRVVLDEAHTIRNPLARASQAVARLDSVTRWCLTGTPIVNTLSDAWPLFRFLHFYPWEQRDHFRDRIARFEKTNDTLAGSRLQVILRGCMLRRTKKSKLGGKPIIQLPARTVQMDEVQLDADEIAIYKAVEENAQAIFNKYLEAGTVLKNYTHIFVMLLRLRQACTHPLLVAENGVLDAAELPSPEEEMARAREGMSPDVFRRVTEALQKMREQMATASDDSTKIEKTEEDLSTMDPCPICLDVAGFDRVVTVCGHYPFCRSCISELLVSDTAEYANDARQARDASKRPCPNCRRPIGKEDTFSIEALLQADTTLPDQTATEPSASRRQEKRKKPTTQLVAPPGASRRSSRVSTANSRPSRPRPLFEDDATTEDTDDEDTYRDDASQDSDDPMEHIGSHRDNDICRSHQDIAEIVETRSNPAPSSKLRKVIEYLQQWHTETPDDKVIIISQWTALLDILGDILYHQKTAYVRYDGAMKPDARAEAVRKFQFDAMPKVMLMSLKAGGVGLNLTRANRVINCDLAWNPASENQAFDRCHRLGQRKDVFVSRLYVKNSVEDRMFALQERKQLLSDSALGGGKHGVGRLNVNELKFLFGMGSNAPPMLPAPRAPQPDS